MDVDTVELIKGFEGCRLMAYQDEGGVWTVGYGCTGPNITYGTFWTLEQAEAELKRRVERLQMQIGSVLETEPTPNELAAMTSLAFNIGLAAFKKSSVLRFYNARDTRDAADAFLMWVKVKGITSLGLVKRRQAERAIFLGEKP
jgi:lysozyme